MSLTRIQQQPPLAQVVADQIRTAIISGDFRLGESISEDRLVTQLGVSRTPVREALQSLAKERLVVILPKRGSFVFETSPEDLAQICDFREMLEFEAVRTALRKDRAGYLAAMNETLAAMETAMATEDFRTYGLMDDKFHLNAFEHAGNSYLNEAFSLVSGRAAALRSNLTASYTERRNLSLIEHRNLIAALEQDDWQEFTAILRHHIQSTGDAYRCALEEGHLG